MLLDHYVSAMDSWKGRIDSETDYDAFRWHQWVQPIDLNDGSAPFTGKLGFAFVGFLQRQGRRAQQGPHGHGARAGLCARPDVGPSVHVFTGGQALRRGRYHLR